MHPDRPPTICLTSDQHTRICDAVKARGLNWVARTVGVPRDTLASVIAGAGRTGSVRNVIAGLPNLTAANAALQKSFGALPDQGRARRTGNANMRTVTQECPIVNDETAGGVIVQVTRIEALPATITPKNVEAVTGQTERQFTSACGVLGLSIARLSADVWAVSTADYLEAVRRAAKPKPARKMPSVAPANDADAALGAAFGIKVKPKAVAR